MSDRFVDTALRRRLITEEQAATLIDSAARQSVPISQVAVDEGLLTPIEVEIIEALAAPEDLAPGYRLIDVLGTGALGVVYQAHQGRMQRDVAIKAILQKRLSQSNVVQRFQKEATAIGRLQHPNIISAFDSGTHRGRLFLVMELVRGTDVRKRIAGGPIPLNHALSIMRQTASGLSHALSQSIIHRDIKPANLLLTDASAGFDLPTGVPLVKIADFGLARLSVTGDLQDDDEALTMTGAALGTPMYCAPEQLMGDPVDHRADIYGLGATLFSMLTGQPPFDDQKIHQLIAAKVTGESPRFERLPDQLPSTVRQLLIDTTRHSPDDRISDYSILIRRIDELIIPPETLRSDDTLSDQRIHSTRRTTRAALVVTFMLFASLLSAAWWVTRNAVSQTPPPTVETLWSDPLFNGESLQGWTNEQSLWIAQRDAEGARVLAGNGTISRTIPPLPIELTGKTIGTGVRVSVDVREAQSADVQLAFSPSQRWAVRVTASTAELGYYRGEGNSFIAVLRVEHTRSGATAENGVAWHEIQFERHGDRWFALFDRKPLSEFDHVETASGPLLRLVANGGQAYFSDLSVFGLQSP